ncbi:hypothetical protein ACN47E_005322 [Coniothyrium glycines]
MAENYQQNLSLEQILATLASLPKHDAQTDPNQRQQQEVASHVYHDFQHVSQPYPPAQERQHLAPVDPRLAGRSTPQQYHPTTKPQDRASTPLIDPSTITEWKQGLRCVNKIATHNPDFVPAVRKLMKDQEQNIKSWETGRARLIEEHDFKRENEKTHRAALSLPGLLEGTALLRTPEREKEELDQYDAKVYRACKAMVESQTSYLKTLGVPFFGVKPYLVVQSVEDLGENIETSRAGVGGKVTKEQLLELQRKILNHLNELYGD